jgi:hypothetical protein
MNKLLPLLLTLAPALALAQDLKPAQEEAKAEFDKTMEPLMKAMNEKCGTKVTVKTDFENFKREAWTGRAYYSWCQPVPDTIAQLCADRPAYKKVLSKSLKGISCLFSGVSELKKDDPTNAMTLRNMSFDKGVFTFHMAPEGQHNFEDNVRKTVENALN